MSKSELDTNKARPNVDLGYPTAAHGNIPSFRNLEEEAEFWDTHSMLDFPDALSLSSLCPHGRRRTQS